MITTTLINRIAITIAIVTALGVILHDTKFDKAATLALSLPAMALSLGAAAHVPNLQSEAHTHIERAAFNKTAQSTSGVPPRDDHRKYLLAKHTNKFNSPEPHTLVYQPSLA